MRIAALAVAVGSTVGSGAVDGMSCLGSMDPASQLVLEWEIPEGPGAKGIRFDGCADWGLHTGGTSAEVYPGSQLCSIQAWRQDGQLLVVSTPVPVDGRATLQRVSFDLPEGPIGGMGVEVRASGGAIAIDRVLPETGADRASLQAGDRVVAVDDTSTRTLSTAGFVRLATGTPGTFVRVEIERDGERRWATVERQRIP